MRLFEVGRKFVVDQATARCTKSPVIAGIAAGPALPEQWGAPKAAVDFFDVKADVEALLRATGASDEFRFEAGSHPALHPGQTARIVAATAQPAGWIGRLHPELERELDLTYSAVVFELEVGADACGASAAVRRRVAIPGRAPRSGADRRREPLPVQKLLDRIRRSGRRAAARCRRVRHLSRRRA